MLGKGEGKRRCDCTPNLNFNAAIWNLSLILITFARCCDADETAEQQSSSFKKKKAHTVCVYDFYFILYIWFPAAQKARDEFDEAEKALRDMDDQIRWILIAGFLPKMKFNAFYFKLSKRIMCFSHFGFTFFFLPRNLEKEISFDFGTSAEFSYLYNQCYEMTTSEYVRDLKKIYTYFIFHIISAWKY